MADEFQEPIVGEDIPQPQETATADEKPKRTRRRKAETIEFDFTVGAEQTQKKAPARRAKKVTATHVTEGVVKLSGLLAVMTQEPIYIVSPEEVAPWAAEAAGLLNSIPSKYIEGAVNLSGYLAVGFGIYSIAAPRQAALAEKKRQAANPNGGNGYPDVSGITSFDRVAS